MERPFMRERERAEGTDDGEDLTLRCTLTKRDIWPLRYEDGPARYEDDCGKSHARKSHARDIWPLGPLQYV